MSKTCTLPLMQTGQPGFLSWASTMHMMASAVICTMVPARVMGPGSAHLHSGSRYLRHHQVGCDEDPVDYIFGADQRAYGLGIQDGEGFFTQFIHAASDFGGHFKAKLRATGGIAYEDHRFGGYCSAPPRIHGDRRQWGARPGPSPWASPSLCWVKRRQTLAAMAISRNPGGVHFAGEGVFGVGTGRRGAEICFCGLLPPWPGCPGGQIW